MRRLGRATQHFRQACLRTTSRISPNELHESASNCGRLRHWRPFVLQTVRRGRGHQRTTPHGCQQDGSTAGSTEASGFKCTLHGARHERQHRRPAEHRRPAGGPFTRGTSAGGQRDTCQRRKLVRLSTVTRKLPRSPGARGYEPHAHAPGADHGHRRRQTRTDARAGAPRPSRARRHRRTGGRGAAGATAEIASVAAFDQGL